MVKEFMYFFFSVIVIMLFCVWMLGNVDVG